MLTCSRYACMSAGEKLRKNQQAKAMDDNNGEKPENTNAIDAEKPEVAPSEKELHKQKQGFLSRWVKKLA